MAANSNNTKAELKVDRAEAKQIPEITKRETYPQVSDKLKGSVIWLVLVFAVIVVILQQFSGYL